MGKFTPSKQQKDIFKFILDGEKNAVISAVAGSGKTTTLLEALKLIPEDKTILFMAFNKSIASELKERVPQRKSIKVMTVHGFGYETIRKSIKESSIDNGKYRKILRDIIQFYKRKNDDVLDVYKFNKECYRLIESMGSMVKNGDIDIDKFVKNVVDLSNLGRLHLIDFDTKPIGVNDLNKLAEIHSIDNEDGESTVAWYLSKLGIYYQDVIDFTDMIMFPNIMNLSTDVYDYVFIDEAQDLSTCQRLLMEKAIKPGTGRFIAVGDPKQCQPLGTKVLMYNGEQKNIEDIQIGDKVVGYDLKNKGSFIGYYKNHRWGAESIKKYGINVLNKKIRKYSGELIRMKSNGVYSKYTPEHKCYAMFNKNKTKGHILYLMEKFGFFRIGISPLWSLDGKTSWTSRAKQEMADKLWVLDIFENREDAYCSEQYESIKNSIPQMRFIDNTKNTKLTQIKIDNFFNNFDKSEMRNNGIKLLKKYNKLYEYPVWERNKSNYFSKNNLFVLEACNIFPKWMLVKHFDENVVTVRTHGLNQRQEKQIKGSLFEIDELIYEKYDGHVVSLEIDKYSNYVSDGILTHNCIYAFAGADNESYQKLKNKSNTIELPLSVTYRCAEPIVKRVKHLNPLIKHFSKNKTGVVHETFSYKDIQDGDMVLCRNTFPIVSLCIKLLSEGKKSYIIGSDIGISLITMINDCERKTEDFTMVNVFSRLYHNKDKLIEKVMSKHKMIKSEAMVDSQVIIMNEKIQAIEVLSEGLSNPHDVIKKINELFSNDKKSGICLSNIHKSKGLEAERVFIIHQELIPSKYAKLQWQIEQERNLEYVAYTRAKTTLGFINDFDAFKSYKSQSDNVVKVNESKHIGSPKMKMKFELKVIDKRDYRGPYGDTIIYEMVDKNGNLFSKFGEISEDFLLGTDDKVEVNSRVSFYGIIKSHSEFKGSKITNLGKITQY